MGPVVPAIDCACARRTSASTRSATRFAVYPRSPRAAPRDRQQVKQKGEAKAASAQRGARQRHLKEYQKDGEITEDELKRGLERVQKETDAGIQSIDELVAKKEKEVMEV